MRSSRSTLCFCNKMRCSRSRASYFSAKMRSSRLASSIKLCQNARSTSHFKNARSASHFKNETRVQPKVAPQHDLRVSILKCESRVQQQRVSKHDLRDSLQKCETCVQQEAAPKYDLRVSLQKCEVRVQPQDAKFKCELVSLHLHEFEASSSYTPATDLRDYLMRKWSTNQIASQCHYERLISTVLYDYHCNFRMTKLSVLTYCQRFQIKLCQEATISQEKVVL